MISRTLQFILAGGVGGAIIYYFYRQELTQIKAEAQRKSESQQPDTQTLRRSLQILNIYSKNFKDTPNITSTLRHIIQLYTSEIMRSPTLAQSLLVDGIIDRLFTFLNLSKNSGLLADTYKLLNNFLCTVSGDLPAVIIAKQEHLQSAVADGLKSDNADVRNACLLFLVNLTVRENL